MFARSLCVICVALVATPALAQQKRVWISYIKSDGLQSLRDINRLLSKIGTVSARNVRSEIIARISVLETLNRAANRFQGLQNIGPGDEAAIRAHNSRCATEWKNTTGPMVRGMTIIMRSGYQSPTAIKKVAENLVKSGKYNALPNGTTFCNKYLNDHAQTAFGYGGFAGKRANQIVDHMRAGKDNWRPVHDPKTGKGERISLQERLGLAQRYANEGRQVVVGWKNANGSGHVAAVVPGKLQKSGKSYWNMMVPQISQAGRSTFSKGMLSRGFGKSKKGQIVIYVRKPK